MNESTAHGLIRAYNAIASGKVIAAKENECDRCSDITDLYVDDVSDLAPSFICIACWHAVAEDARYTLNRLKRFGRV